MIGVMDLIKSIAEKVTKAAVDAVDEVKFQAENAVLATSDAVEGVIDTATAGAAKVYGGAKVAWDNLKTAGLFIAFITAPVPTAVGLALFWLMEDSVSQHKKDIDDSVELRSNKRDFERVVGLLKKYGKIPKTAQLSTDFLEMEIDSVEGKVDGVVLVGDFKGQPLSSISNENLEYLSEAAPDDDTKALLESYVSFRKKAEEAK